MMSLSTIRELSREAAAKARKEGKQPFTVEACDVADFRAGKSGRLHLPFIGDLVPKGWKRFNLDAYSHRHAYYEYQGDGAFFVDTSGWGAPGEPALTRDEMLSLLADVAEQNDYRVAWALIEAGQFQGHIAAFVKKEKRS